MLSFSVLFPNIPRIHLSWSHHTQPEKRCPRPSKELSLPLIVWSHLYLPASGLPARLRAWCKSMTEILFDHWLQRDLMRSFGGSSCPWCHIPIHRLSPVILRMWWGKMVPVLWRLPQPRSRLLGQDSDAGVTYSSAQESREPAQSLDERFATSVQDCIDFSASFRAVWK